MTITKRRSRGATPCDDQRDRQDSDLSRGMNLRGLLEKVAGPFGVDTDSLESGSKAPTRAKARAPEVVQREEIKGEWLEYQ